MEFRKINYLLEGKLFLLRNYITWKTLDNFCRKKRITIDPHHHQLWMRTAIPGFKRTLLPSSASFHFENNHCVLCNQTFSRGSNFKRHIREIHKQHKVPCWVYNRQYLRPDRLKLHFEDAYNMML